MSSSGDVCNLKGARLLASITCSGSCDVSRRSFGVDCAISVFISSITGHFVGTFWEVQKEMCDNRVFFHNDLVCGHVFDKMMCAAGGLLGVSPMF